MLSSLGAFLTELHAASLLVHSNGVCTNGSTEQTMRKRRKNIHASSANNGESYRNHSILSFQSFVPGHLKGNVCCWLPDEYPIKRSPNQISFEIARGIRQIEWDLQCTILAPTCKTLGGKNGWVSISTRSSTGIKGGKIMSYSMIVVGKRPQMMDTRPSMTQKPSNCRRFYD